MRYFIHSERRPSWLATALLASLFVAHPGQVSMAAPLYDAGQVQDFDVPAQPLGAALLAFAQQSGLQLTIDDALLAGRRSAPLMGHMSKAAALDQLLRDSGIAWSVDPHNMLTFSLAPSGVTGAALNLLKTPAPPVELAPTLVLGEVENAYAGATVIDRRSIQAFPGANGDITTLLQMHPLVSFDNAQKGSNSPGEIEPANISINGAKYYQNSFMIDGVGINNDLDPGANSYNEIRQFDSTPSRAHGIALDADLLQEVRVYDSNVPAEYGGFNGGVVDAITRAPSQALHGKLSAAMTRSEWTRYHISEADRGDFETASDEQYQPEFVKTTVRGTLEGHLTENFGALLNFSRKRSTIPLHAYSDGYSSQTKDQTRELDNYLLKTYWQVNEQLLLDTSFTYAPQDSYYFVANRKDSGFTTQNGGYQASIKATWLADRTTWTHTLALTDLHSSRDAESDDYVNWYYSSTKNWGRLNGNTSRSAEGSFGDLEQTQRGVSYKLKGQWLPVSLGASEHRVGAGLEWAHTRATWERADDAQAATGLGRDNGACLSGDALCSNGTLLNGSNRQYATTYTRYAAGRLETQQNQLGVFLEDQIVLGRYSVRPGLRLDYDSYSTQTTLAPRLAMDYDLFGDRSTVLVAGANRYYGRNLYKYALSDGRQALNTTYTRRTYNGAWTATRQVNTTRYSSLDVPYDDELMAGIQQQWLGTDVDFKYVHRFGRDKITRSTAKTQQLESGDGSSYVTNYYTWTNAGRSETDSLTLTVTPRQRLDWLGTQTSAQLAANWTRTKDAYTDYESVLDANEYADGDVVYDGKLTRWSELPARNFNRPWTLRLTTITDIPALNLDWSNFFRYRGSYDQIVDTGDDVALDGIEYALYEKARVPGAFTWDTQVAWELPLRKDEAVFVTLDITNLTDKVNRIVSATSGATTYETGRQYWLEVGYRF